MLEPQTNLMAGAADLEQDNPMLNVVYRVATRNLTTATCHKRVLHTYYSFPGKMGCSNIS
jgi:hypothetical protein